MSWFAKPSGGYDLRSEEAVGNGIAMNGFFNARGYTLEAQAGIIGNCYHESGLNPWRWQNDIVNRAGGYGLFQFTPASQYLDWMVGGDYYAPNLSTSYVTGGAQPYDGYNQLLVLDQDQLNKWSGYCWRPYWSTVDYAELYAMRARILQTYGDGVGLTYDQFKLINNVSDATFAFLACYEGPAVPNFYVREATANYVFNGLNPYTPDDPPLKPVKKKKIFFYLKPYWRDFIK